MDKKSDLAYISDSCCCRCFTGYYDTTSDTTSANYSCTISAVMGTRASRDKQTVKIRRNSKLRAMNNVWFKPSQLQLFDF